MDATPQDNMTADTRGSDFAIASFDIAPEDQALANEIANFDPVYDTSGPTSVTGAVKLPAAMKVSGLSPHLRDPIIARLATLPADRRDVEEAQLVHDALYQNSLGIRIVCGPGEGANAFQREKFALTFEMEETEREIVRLGTQLGEVERWDTVTDPSTGAVTPLAVDKLQGQRRNAVSVEHRRLLHKLDQLNGAEGQHRLKKAKFEAVQDSKALTAQLTEDREARSRAETDLREERVAERAALYAKHKRTTR